MLIKTGDLEPSKLQRAIKEGRVKFINARLEKSKPAPGEERRKGMGMTETEKIKDPEIRELAGLFKIGILQFAARLEELDRRAVTRSDMIGKLEILKERLIVLPA